MSALVHALLTGAAVYLLAGLAFAVPFVLAGAPRLDPAARGSSWGFRVIIIPGVAALWPWLAWRWSRGGPPMEQNAHREHAREPTS